MAAATGAMAVALLNMTKPTTTSGLSSQILIGALIYAGVIFLGFPKLWKSPASIALRWRRQDSL